MTTSFRPTVQRRRLRTELRRAREAKGLTREQVADAMDWSLSKINRIEAGTVGVSTNDLRALIGLYDVTDPELTTALTDLAKSSRQRIWWAELQQRPAARTLPGPLFTYIGFEAEASRISHYCTTVLPGLFQTVDYIRALVGGLGERLQDAQVQAGIELRLERQRRAFGRADPPELVALLDEATLRRVIGGPVVMAAQLDHLVELSRRPGITIRVLPFSAGSHPKLGRPFTVMEFDDPADDIVYLDGGLHDVFLQESPEEVAQHRVALETLTGLALDDDESRTLIRSVADLLPG